MKNFPAAWPEVVYVDWGTGYYVFRDAEWLNDWTRPETKGFLGNYFISTPWGYVCLTDIRSHRRNLK